MRLCIQSSISSNVRHYGNPTYFVSPASRTDLSVSLARVMAQIGLVCLLFKGHGVLAAKCGRLCWRFLGRANGNPLCS